MFYSINKFHKSGGNAPPRFTSFSEIVYNNKQHLLGYDPAVVLISPVFIFYVRLLALRLSGMMDSKASKSVAKVCNMFLTGIFKIQQQ